MSLPNEYSIECEECGTYNISNLKCEDCWKKGFLKLIDKLKANYPNRIEWNVALERLKQMLKEKA